MRNNVKLSYRLHRSKPNRIGEFPIVLSIFFKGKGVRLVSGFTIKDEYWDKKQKIVKPEHEKAELINDGLEAFKDHVVNIINNLIKKNITITPEKIREFVNVKISKDLTIVKVLDLAMDILKTKPTITSDNYNKYVNTKKTFLLFLKSTQNIDDGAMSLINEKLALDFEEYLIKQARYSTKTVNKIHQRFTRLLLIAADNGIIVEMPYSYRSNEYKFNKPTNNDKELLHCEIVPEDLIKLCAFTQTYTYVVMEKKDLQYHREDAPNLYKFGYSKNPYVRLKEMQTGSAHVYVTLKYYKNVGISIETSFENYLHKHYIGNNYHGEWFMFDSKINIVEQLVNDYHDYLRKSLIVEIKKPLVLPLVTKQNVDIQVMNITYEKIIDAYKQVIEIFGETKPSKHLVAHRLKIGVTKLVSFIDKNPQLKTQIKLLTETI